CKVGLAKKVTAAGRIIICRQRYKRRGRIRRTRHIVLVETVVVAVCRPVMKREATDLAVERDGKKIYICPYAAVFRVSVKCRDGHIRRAASARRNTAIGGPAVAKKLV